MKVTATVDPLEPPDPPLQEVVKPFAPQLANAVLLRASNAVKALA